MRKGIGARQFYLTNAYMVTTTGCCKMKMEFANPEFMDFFSYTNINFEYICENIFVLCIRNKAQI